MNEHKQGPGLPQVINLVLAVVLGLSVVGFLLGIRPAASVSGLTVREAPAAPRGVSPGKPYRALRQGATSRGEVTSDLSRLRASIPAVTAKVPPQTAALRQQALATRARRGAYDGAPPTVPHPVEWQTSAACLACHQKGMRLQGRLAPPLSHPIYANCTQCHAPGIAGEIAGGLQVASSFEGLSSAGKGPRAWPGAPPQIPHAVSMRENCAACHGVTGREGMRTDHPQRQNCTQCHVPR